eukprot:CFRG5263T1
MTITKSLFSTGQINFASCDGETIQGVHEITSKWTLTNRNGMSISVTDYGATLVSVNALDRSGNAGETLIFFDSLQEYASNGAGHGATIGRYANRIAGGTFEINGEQFSTVLNDCGRPNTLHAGRVPWQHRLWSAEEIHEGSTLGIIFSIVSADGDEGFPGEVHATVTYSINDDNEVRIYYEAASSKDTIINLTNHGYWNLSGDLKSSSIKHDFLLNASQYLPVDENCIPIGIVDVTGTPFDVRRTTNVGKAIEATGGFDNCFVIDRSSATPIKPDSVSGGSSAPAVYFAAELSDSASGRNMTVLTSEPGIQVYTYNHEPADDTKAPHSRFWGICFEAEHYPNGCNHPEWPSCVLKKGEMYKQLTVHQFSTF